MSPLLAKEDAAEIMRMFQARLIGDVKLLLFTSKRGCIYCAQNKQLLEEVVALTDKVRLETLDLEKDRSRAQEMIVDLAPTTVIVASNGARLHFVGMPTGRQLRCLVEDIIDASRGQTEMDEGARDLIKRVSRETTIKVFVTPFCPYSPLVVRSAHRFALENPLIRAFMVETLEFPELAKRYRVIGVPVTVINEGAGFDGSPSEKVFAEKVLAAEPCSPR
jgi:glutaredoxin-like protein